MTEDDDKFLASLNESKSGKDGHGKCTEDVFEEVFSFFESAVEKHQPYAAVDNAPVMTFGEIESYYDEEIGSEARKWASDIYSHWKTTREEVENHSLMSPLKMETGKETDDADAYVCFRRREVRQARKTRGRDAQVVEKLKKLRRELEEARQLVHFINQREKLLGDKYECDRKVFEQRCDLKRVKTQHGIKGDNDDELLVNQRPAPKVKQRTEAQRPATLRLSTSQRGEAPPRPAENDLVQLSDLQQEAADTIQRAVEIKIGKHREWNKGFLDQTWDPITPPVDTAAMSSYLPRVEEYQLPTPPSSVSSEQHGGNGGDEMKGVEKEGGGADLPTPVSDLEEAPRRTMFRFASSKPDGTAQDFPSYRRRFGRNGVLHIEECRPQRTVMAEHTGVVYDSAGDSEDETIVHSIDYHGNWTLNYRASLLSSRARTEPTAEHASRRSSSLGQSDVAMANGQSTAGQAQPPPQPHPPTVASGSV